MKILLFFFVFLVFFNFSLANGQKSRGRRALYSLPSHPEISKRVVKIKSKFDGGNYTLTEHCTGALLNESIVLSAAHCIVSGNNETMESFVVEGNGQVSEGGGHIWRLSTYKHLDADSESDDGACHDVAVLFLNKPIKIPLTEESPRLVIDCGREVFMDGECSSHGTGLTETGNMSDIVLRVPLPAIKHSKLKGLDNGACFETIYDGRERVCPGDSGGPVICSNSGNKLSLIGVNAMLLYSGESKKPANETEMCALSFASIMTNTKAIRLLVKRLPSSFKRQFKESVQFEDNCGIF